MDRSLHPSYLTSTELDRASDILYVRSSHCQDSLGDYSASGVTNTDGPQLLGILIQRNEPTCQQGGDAARVNKDGAQTLGSECQRVT